MKKPSPWYKRLLTGLLFAAAWNVAAQPAVDASASFAPPLTETSVIYAAFSTKDGNVSADAVLALSEDPDNLAISLPGGSNGANSHVALPPFNHNSLPITIEMWYLLDPVQNYYATLWYNRGSNSNSGVQYDRWVNTKHIKGVWNASAEVPDFGPTPGQWNHVALVVREGSK